MRQVICIGGVCIDRKYHTADEVEPRTSNPVQARRNFGGVARNVAENLARLQVSTGLCSIVGTDENGCALLDHAQRCGVEVSLVIRDRNRVTAEYAAIIGPCGDLFVAVCDMTAIDAIRIEDLKDRWDAIRACEWLFVDCNLSADVLAWCIAEARRSGVKIAADAVSAPKASRLPHDLHGIDLLLLNEREAAAYLHEQPDTLHTRAPLEWARAVRAHGAGAVMLTRGAHGLVVCEDSCADIPALNVHCVDETGAGDALVAGTLYRLLQGDMLIDAARTGALCAGLTVECATTVRADLSPELLKSQHHRLGTCIVS